jgi:hypothetical protein
MLITLPFCIKLFLQLCPVLRERNFRRQPEANAVHVFVRRYTSHEVKRVIISKSVSQRTFGSLRYR